MDAMLWPKLLPARSDKNRWSHTKQTVSKRRVEKAVARLRLEDLEDRAVPATLWTDQADYAPGTMATLYGSGFAPGETIHLNIVSDNGGVGADFAITDGGLRDADKTVDGKFTTSWFVDHSNANAFLSATAIGQFSGVVATTTFTDSGLGTPINISIANGWTPGGDNGTNPVTTVSCPDGDIITKIAIKTGEGGGFLLENLTGVPGDENTGSMHSPVIVQDGYLGKGNPFSTTPPASGPYYAVSGLGTSTVTVTAVNGANQFGGGFSHVDYYCKDVPPPPDDPVTLEGRKFNDLNGNGMYDTGEAGIGSWPIQLQVGNESTLIYTNEDGYYSATFTVSEAALANGIPYFVQEGSLTGWTQTYGMGGYSGTFTLQNEVVSNLDFGNFKNFALEGQKFEDHNGNGVQDAEDQGLSGWTVVLNGPSGMMTAVTDGAGNYRFENLGPGIYTVQEEQQGGWTQTYGLGGYTVTGASGTDATENDFGNFKNVDINGLKFYDSDANGVRNLTEPGING
ncbi:MAG: SdrD B-like domain-containing protein [Gemmataceae bacterium]